MANYCSITDVEALEAGRRIVFSDGSAGPPVVAATVPTATQVNAWITAVNDEINETILRAGYQIPITGNVFLKQCNAMGAAYYVELALTTKGDSDSTGNRDHRQKEYQRMLADLIRDPRVAGAVSASGSQRTYATGDGVSNFTNDDPNISFHANEKDW